MEKTDRRASKSFDIQIALSEMKNDKYSTDAND
jgi:hypothetical protein